MMRDNFWQGLVYGSIIGIVLGAVIAPLLKPQKNILELSKDALVDTTSDFIGQAKRAQKKFIRRIS